MALGEAVARAFDVAWPGEIFHNKYADPFTDYRCSKLLSERANFFNFRHELFRVRPELSIPSGENQSTVFTLYLDNLRSVSRSDDYLIDIKYTSWHHLNTFWWTGTRKPFLIDLVMRLGISVIHLRRRNHFSMYCSQKLAEQTGVWWTSELRELAGECFVVNLEDCKRYMEEVRVAERSFDNWLSKHSCFQLTYEEIFSQEGLSQTVEKTFSEIFSRPPSAPLSTTSKKVTPPLRSVVKNADEVISCFKGTPYQSMAEEVLA